MQKHQRNQRESRDSNTLEGEVQSLFNQAISSRFTSGVTSDLRVGYVRSSLDDNNTFPEIKADENCGCECSEEQGESCELCDKPLEDVCTLSDTVDWCKKHSYLTGISHLLETTKKHEYYALLEEAYAPVGDRPFKLKARNKAVTPDEDIEQSGTEFYEFLENFLEQNQVRVHQIPDAFNLETLSQVGDELVAAADKQADDKLRQSIRTNEEVIHRVFKRSQYMKEYIQVKKDTADHRIGVMWLDDNVLLKTDKIVGGKLTFEYHTQCDANRIDPRYFWATPDYKLHTVGQAVFTLRQYSSGDIARWKGTNDILDENITEYLEDNEVGFTMYEACLFEDDRLLRDGKYDVLVSRGRYTREGVEALGLPVPTIYKDENMIPCELRYSGGLLLHARVMQCIDEHLGVYTTVFKRKGDNLFGYSLHDFIHPFAKFYEGIIKGIDKSASKVTGSLIQMDTGVIDDPTKYFSQDDKGEVALDLSDDMIVEFDSTEAMMSPNFKGVPIHISKLPSDTNQLIPLIGIVYQQIDKITGIPTLLTDGSNVSSALRTTDIYNAAYAASAKTTRSLLREGEVRILQPSINFIFKAKALSGDIDEFLIEADPEILLSDTLTTEFNTDRQLIQHLSEIGSFASLLPADKLAGFQDRFAALLNHVGHESFNLEEDLVSGVNPLSTSDQGAAVQSV